MTLLGNIMAEGRVRLEAAEAINQQDVPRGSCNPSRSHSICRVRTLAKLQVPLRLKHSVTNLHEGGFGKLIFRLIERCAVTARRIKLLFRAIHFLSLAYQPVFIKHHLLCGTLC